jgi:Putative DNA-binding domain
MVGASLVDLQRHIRRALLDGAIDDVASAFEADGIDPAARLRIYRNHALMTFDAALRAAFPVVCRLVDERFFAYATHEFLRLHPPCSRRRAEYGADFPDFLARFEACKDLPYLTDVARFEWALNMAAMVRAVPPLEIHALHSVPPDLAGYAVFQLQPSLRYCASSWPIDAIWRANQRKDVPWVELDNSGASIEIRRGSEGVVWQPLDPGNFAFRTALVEGFALAAAITRAMQEDPRFDATMSLQRVFAEGLVVDFRILWEAEATR